MNLTKTQMLDAIAALDRVIPRQVELIMGGGGAMILAHQIPLVTSDIDAVPRGMSLLEIDPCIKQVGRELGLAPDWLNPYYSTFAHVLPQDYAERLIEVYRGQRLAVLALGKEDMLIMKCFAHRQKDIGHAKALIKKGASVGFVSDHIEALGKKGIPGVREAIEFLDDIQE